MSEMRPFATPIYRLKDDSRLMSLHRKFGETKKEVYKQIFEPIYEILENYGVEHENAKDFSFYTDEYFGFYASKAPQTLSNQLKVSKKGFRGFKKRSAVGKEIRAVFEKNDKLFNTLTATDYTITQSYRKFFSGINRHGGFGSFIVYMPQVIEGEYFIGGKNVKTDSAELEKNYEPYDYDEYLKKFSVTSKKLKK